jgi:hypothetical protein
MKTALLPMCFLLSGCLLEPLRTHSAGGWEFRYTRPPIVDVTTPLLLDRETGRFEALTTDGSPTVRLRGRSAPFVLEPPALLPAPVPIAVTPPPLPLPAPVVAPVLPTPQCLPPPALSEESIRGILIRLAALEKKTEGK